MNCNKQIVVILGPTASGKSALAVKIAKQIGGEIISADSRQVYRGLNLGTGKITESEMRGVPHHMLDVADAKKNFTAFDFCVQATEAVRAIMEKGHTPIICGGTGFYIDALLGRVTLADVPRDEELRKKLTTKTVSQLYSMLCKLDPERAKKIDALNPVRLIRAIEIAKGKQSTQPAPTLDPNEYDIAWIGIRPERYFLKTKIANRLHARTKQGMITEVKRLQKGGLSWKRMHELGLEYRSIALYLRKKISKKVMLEQLESDIAHYAKRQMTYWKRNKEITWIDSDAAHPTDPKRILRLLKAHRKVANSEDQ